ncbi:uncharacterized protein BO72DRAFT_528224 [Aspergillus fijiensis CBS 313.89]|uniref:Stc1 domain-containing protein n=1 Tax=Aspergillus fijiensis CBS 313.89 TaxID=1448319 RepID=A0A8G1VYM7_9EURO|nr:uncharacterized protein BO72DRAFT_528224 [Aspergillus fijiensis CBS 313.89]RAK76608.1 hypothetical protein BO72DRAFT_528224 [Aspergillus fijiensis CBS 313.89]
MSLTRKAPSAYGGGYSDALRERINNTIIPEKVKCASCKKYRTVASYSKRQQEIIRHAIVLQGKRAADGGCEARCRQCIGGCIVELKCSICDKTKTLEHFAKNQRGDRDTARCLNCVQNALEVDPMPERQRQFSGNLTVTASGTSTSQGGVTALTQSAQKMNIADNRSFDDGADDENAGGEDGARKNEGALVTTKNDREFAGHGPDGQVFQVATPDKKVPETRYEDYFNNEPEKLQPDKPDGKWAKIPGRRIPKGKEPSMRVPEPNDDIVPSDEDEDEEDLENWL